MNHDGWMGGWRRNVALDGDRRTRRGLADRHDQQDVQEDVARATALHADATVARLLARQGPGDIEVTWEECSHIASRKDLREAFRKGGLVMKTRMPWIAIVVLCLLSSVAAAASAKMTPADELRMGMRMLWEEHITYTRNYIISALADLPDRDAVAQRLLKNQDDIGNAIKPFYGDQAGQKLAALLRDHIMIATEVVKAAKASNSEQLDVAQKKWSANGKDIAAFLSSANPNWPKQTLESMLQKHLDLTTGEVVGRLKKDWAADIKSYDDGHAHMLMFADALTDGITKQFPEKLKG
jgi:hypothetical protein